MGELRRPVLVRVEVNVLADQALVRFVLDGTVPGKGVYLLGLRAVSADNSRLRHVGIKFRDGTPAGFFTFDFESGKLTDHGAENVGKAAKTVSGFFPASSLTDLGRAHRVGAYAIFNGTEIQSGLPVHYTRP